MPEKNIPEPTANNQPKSTDINRITKRPRPLVEGINAPMSRPRPAVTAKPGLTSAEQNLINSVNADSQPTRPQPLSEIFQTKTEPTKQSSSGKFGAGFWAFVAIIVLLALSYYFWITNSSQNQSSDNSKIIQYQPPASTPVEQNTSTNNSLSPTASSTPIASTTVGSEDVGKPPAELFTQPQQLTITKTPTGYLNVRQQPSSSSKLVGKVKPGETYSYTTAQNGWYEITLADGTKGWVLGTYVSVNK